MISIYITIYALIGYIFSHEGLQLDNGGEQLESKEQFYIKNTQLTYSYEKNYGQENI
jgi:hypothetical protein